MGTNMMKLTTQASINLWAIISLTIGVLLWVFAAFTLWPSSISYESQSPSDRMGLFVTLSVIFIPIAGIYSGWRSLKDKSESAAWSLMGISINGVFLACALMLVLLAMFGKV